MDQLGIVTNLPWIDLWYTFGKSKARIPSCRKEERTGRCQLALYSMFSTQELGVVPPPCALPSVVSFDPSDLWSASRSRLVVLIPLLQRLLLGAVASRSANPQAELIHTARNHTITPRQLTASYLHKHTSRSPNSPTTASQISQITSCRRGNNPTCNILILTGMNASHSL